MPNDIAKTLKICRNNAGISVKQISEILTLKGFKASESTIYSWENGNSQPTPGALLIMCNAYGIKDVLSTFGYDGYNEDGSLMLNMHEIDLVEKYRNLDSHGQEMVDFILKKEYERSVALKEQLSNIKEFPQTHLDVNAANSRNATAEQEYNANRIMTDDSEWE